VKALYELRNKIAGFDFFPWLVMQAQAGATEIVFNTRKPNCGKWPLETVMRRFESILRPGPALLGLPCSIGMMGVQLAPYHQADLVRLSYAGVEFPRLRTVLPAGKERYTVTLRRTQRAEGRNSREADWMAFAREIGARVIPDYDDEPIHLHDRMALYAGAEMNFFVTNGPVMLCFLSEYPAMGFDVQSSPMVKFGVPFGQPYPFLLPQHRQIYEPDELPVIRRHFEQWLGEKG
jgi:hypothetical protein